MLAGHVLQRGAHGLSGEAAQHDIAASVEFLRARLARLAWSASGAEESKFEEAEAPEARCCRASSWRDETILKVARRQQIDDARSGEIRRGLAGRYGLLHFA